MDFLDISKKRITVRRFSRTPVEKEKIQKILEAGRWSPTAVNGHPQSGESSGATDATIVRSGALGRESPTVFSRIIAYTAEIAPRSAR